MRPHESFPAARRSADLESDSCVTQDHTMDTSPAPYLLQATDDEKASRQQKGLFANFDGTRRDDGCGQVDEVAAYRTLTLIIIIGH